jgi:hypothetical protein
MSLGRKARHLNPNLGNHGGSTCLQVNWQALDQLDGILIRHQSLINLLLHVLNGLLQEIRVRQDLLQEKLMMRLHSPFEG